MTAEITPDQVRQVLDLEIDDGGGTATTVRGYLLALLAKLWTEADDFSGKRPFGSSDWQCDVYVPLIKAGLIPGSLDEDGYIEQIDYKVADALMLAAIAELGAPRAQITLTGYQGAAAHTFTAACDGFHPIGQQCNLPAVEQPVTTLTEVSLWASTSRPQLSPAAPRTPRGR